MFLLALIDGLPPSSRTVSAILNDPDVARVEALAEAVIADEDDEDSESASRSSLVGQTPEVTVLQDIFDLIISALGGDERYPRPVTAVSAAIERIREERMLAAAQDVIAAMTPWAL